MKLYQMTDEQLTVYANQVKEVILRGLSTEGLLNGDPEVVSATYAVLPCRKHLLGRMWDNIRGRNYDNDTVYYEFLKHVSVGDAEDKALRKD